MPRKLKKLTWNGVQREGRYGNHSDGGGLYLRVGKTKTKSWIFRYRVDGKLTDMGLGCVDAFNLDEARNKARKLRQELDAFRAGEALHPLAVKRAKRDAAKLERLTAWTFRQCAEAYMAERKWGNPRHAKQWPATLTAYVYPKIGDLPVKAID